MMGQRANLVLVESDDWQLYYDHWCANVLDVEMFWGPNLALEFIRQRDPLSDRGQWLDEVWCEGGVVLDLHRRRLLWYGGEDVQYNVPLRRALLELMREQWRGWDVRWAAGGIVEIGGYVGMSPVLFLTRDLPDPAEVLRPAPEEGFTNFLLTVREDGTVTAAAVNGDEESIEFGSCHLPTMLAIPRHSSLQWNGDLPSTGLHLDLDEQAIWYWCAKPVEALVERVARGWPGWSATFLGDRFEDHLTIAAADVDLPVASPTELKRQVVDRLRRLCDQPGRNVARDLAQRLSDGRPMSVNPWTDEVRGSVGAREEKLRVLERLERSLA